MRAQDPFAEAPRWAIDAAAIRLRLTDRVVARTPALQRRLGPRLLTEPAGSTLRRRLLTRALTAGWAATEQRNYAVLESLYSPDFEGYFSPEVNVDFPEHVSGWPAFQRLLDGVFEAWVAADYTLVEIIDPGGPFVVNRARISGEGRFTSIELGFEIATLYELDEVARCRRQWMTTGLDALGDFYTERRAQLDQGEAP